MYQKEVLLCNEVKYNEEVFEVFMGEERMIDYIIFFFGFDIYSESVYYLNDKYMIKLILLSD